MAGVALDCLQFSFSVPRAPLRVKLFICSYVHQFTTWNISHVPTSTEQKLSAYGLM